MADEQIPSTSGAGAGNFEDDEPYAKRRLYSSEVRSMWNLAKIIRQLGTREQGLAFAEEQNLILATKNCRNHRQPMSVKLTANKTVGVFVCNKGACRNKTISRSKGTWFENAKLELPHIYYLSYCFAHHWSHDQVIFEDFHKYEHCLARPTITDWYNYCREVIVLYQIGHMENIGKIGGPGKVVQVDESKFGKRKYNKGRHVEGHWVLGLIEDGSEDLRLEVCPDNVRTAQVLIPLIKKHVVEGTTIHTDSWRAYDCLAEHGFIHKKVNHSDPDNPFIAEDGTHTQRKESQWRVVKRFFYKNNYNHPSNFADVIVEYMWRREILKKKLDPFVELIKAIKDIYKPQ